MKALIVTLAGVTLGAEMKDKPSSLTFRPK